MKNIIRSISKGIGSIDIKNLTEFDIDEIDIPNFNELNIDIQIKSSKITENDFKCHCEKGIPENMDLLRQEFNLYRGIKPIKIIISGPPCGGKTYIAKKIAN
jgi:adenylate kinase